MPCSSTVVLGCSVLAILALTAVVILRLSQGEEGKCPEGTFTCTKSFECIPKRYMCNKHDDCLDGEDETFRECAAGLAFDRELKVEVNAINQSAGLKYATNELDRVALMTQQRGPLAKYAYGRYGVSHYCKDFNIVQCTVDWTGGTASFFRKIKPKPANDSENDKPYCDLNGYPNKFCVCTGRSSLNCANAGFTSLPASVPRRVTSLNLMNNSLLVTDNIFEGFNDLNLLDLDNNKIRILPKNAFQGMPVLLRLLLSNNNIEVIEDGVFTNLPRVRTLKLNNNCLSRLNLQIFGGLLKLNWIDLSFNFLTLDNDKFPALPELEYLKLRSNSIRHIHKETFANLVGMVHLSLRENKIISIHKETFSNLKSLEDLDLSHNQLHIISSEILNPLKALATLRLGHNTDLIVPDNVFLELKNLSSLNLQDIEIDNINVDMFEVLINLKFVYFKRFHYCSYAPAVKQCKPNTDGVSSFGHLLEKPVLRITVWLMAFFTCFANLLVLWGRHMSYEDNHAFSFIVKSLAVSDFLIGLYLLAIAYHDFMYREVYNREAHSWMTSWKCTMIGILAMTSSEVSVLILVFMSIERFLSIADTFGAKRSLSLKKAILSTAAIWVVGIFIAIVPVMLWRGKSRFYGTNGLCFPLHIDDPFFIGWQYSAFIFLGINMFGLLLMSFFYGRIFLNISRTRKATPVNVKEYDLVIRCFFFVVADAGCWLPIFVLKILAFLKIPISADLYAWVVVFILPVNSAVNPILYTFTTQRYRNFFFKIVQTRRVDFWQLSSNHQALFETEISGPATTKQELAHPIDRDHWF